MPPSLIYASTSVPPLRAKDKARQQAPRPRHTAVNGASARMECVEMLSDVFARAWGIAVFTASVTGLVWAATIWLKGRP